MFKLAQGLCKLPNVNVLNVVKRFPHFDPLYEYPDPNNLPKYEVTKDPKEWEFVERLLPQTTIPEPPTEKKAYPSGWKPQTVKPDEYPYYLKRSSNYMLPVYLKVEKRGQMRRTSVRNIHGDIYALANELKNYLQPKHIHRIEIKVHEISGEIVIRGDHVSNVKVWLEERNF